MVNFFTTNPFSVSYNGKENHLDRSDITKIIVTTLAGTVIPIIGNIFAFLISSYYFRNRKMRQLKVQDLNPQDGQTATLAAGLLQGINPSPQVLPKKSKKLQSLEATFEWHERNCNCISFYKAGDTSFLGNFHACKVFVFGHTFECSEAAFQWKKFDLLVKDDRFNYLNEEEQKKILSGISKLESSNGEDSFKIRQELDALFSQIPNFWPKGWKNGGRDKVMWEILQAKFTQNLDLMEALRASKQSYLLEHNQRPGRDTYWSDNNDGSGHNMLGKMLMAIRDGKEKPAQENEKFVAPDKTWIKQYAQNVNKNKEIKKAIF